MHRALVRAATEDALYASVCDALTTETPFSLATIAVPEDKPVRRIRIVAAAGKAVDYVKGLSIRWDETSLGEGPAGRAARTRAVQFNDDLLTDPRFAPWRKRASEFGLRSSFVLPVCLPNGTFAILLSVYSERVAAVDQEQLARFQVLGDDLGACIEIVRTRSALQSALTRTQRQSHKLEILGRAFENSAASVIITGPDNLIADVNGAFEHLFGYTREEVIERDPSLLASGKHDRAFFRRMWSELRERGSWSGDIVNLTKSGREVVCLLNISVARDALGAATTYIASFQDITEQRQSTEALVREKAISQAIMESMPGVVYFSDRQGQFLRWNRNLETISGYSPGEIEHMHPLDLISTCDRSLARNRFDQVFTQGSAEFEAALTTKFGAVRPYLFSGRRLNYAGQEFLIGVGIDIGTQKDAESALAEHVEVLQRLSRQILEVQEQERAALSRELHDSIAQDLGAVSLNLAIFRNLLPPEPNTALTQRIDDSQELLEEATQRIRNVMSDLRPPGLDEFGLVPALRAHGERVARRAGFDIRVTGQNPTPPLAQADTMALFRIAQEALNNIVKHAHASLVEIILASSADAVTLKISDDGIGFNSADSGRNVSGMGLVTMAERAELIGAQCTVQSIPGRGTVVTVFLDRRGTRVRS